MVNGLINQNILGGEKKNKKKGWEKGIKGSLNGNSGRLPWKSGSGAGVGTSHWHRGGLKYRT